MTLKTRNRINLIFTSISFATLLYQSCFLLYFFLHDKLTFSSIYDNTKTGFFLFISQDLYVMIGILFQFLLVIIDSYIVYRTFIKTQAPEVPFFIIFLLGILFDTFRIWIPTFSLSNSYSSMYLFCGNATLFSHILAPLGLLLLAIVPFTELKQNYDKLAAVIILISLFLATLIPLNTTKTLPNFSVDYSFKKLMITYTIISYGATLIAHFFNNKGKAFNQLTTVGLALLMIGLHLLQNSMTLIALVSGIAAVSLGSVFFLKELHNQYLWTD